MSIFRKSIVILAVSVLVLQFADCVKKGEQQKAPEGTEQQAPPPTDTTMKDTSGHGSMSDTSGRDTTMKDTTKNGTSKNMSGKSTNSKKNKHISD